MDIGINAFSLSCSIPAVFLSSQYKSMAQLVMRMIIVCGRRDCRSAPPVKHVGAVACQIEQLLSLLAAVSSPPSPLLVR